MASVITRRTFVKFVKPKAVHANVTRVVQTLMLVVIAVLSATTVHVFIRAPATSATACLVVESDTESKAVSHTCIQLGAKPVAVL